MKLVGVIRARVEYELTLCWYSLISLPRRPAPPAHRFASLRDAFLAFCIRARSSMDVTTAGRALPTRISHGSYYLPGQS